MNRINKNILNIIIKNNRLKRYEEYINKFKKNGYKIEGLESFYAHREENGKHLILRHDVDFKGKATKLMYEKEKELGVKSTYYFRKDTLDIELAKDMISNGFEVGFHFETISNYIKNNKIDKKENIDINEIINVLNYEIDEFSNKINYRINSICSHGDIINSKYGISNNWITENFLERINIVFEAYGNEIYKNINSHIMDCDLTYNLGFAYNDNPISCIKKSDRNIIFLTHPNHWHMLLKTRIKQVIKVLLKKTTNNSDRKFIRVIG